MAYDKASTLNNNLKMVSDIGIWISFKDGTYTDTIYVPYNGKTSIWFGFRQPNDLVNPYQIQHRESYRYTAELAAQKGDDWTGWLVKATNPSNGVKETWQNSRAMAASGSQYPAIAYGAALPIMNNWRRANKGVDKESIPTTAFLWADWSFGENYEAAAVEIRIRTYNYATATHGAVVTKQVHIYRCADVQDAQGRIAHDGGINIMFNYTWSRAISARIKSVKNADGQECLVGGELTLNVRSQSRENGAQPAKHGDMKGGMVHIPREKLNYQFFYNRDCTIELDILTDRQAPTPVTVTRILGGVTNVAQPTIGLTQDEDKGTITAVVEGAGKETGAILWNPTFDMQVPISVVKDGNTVTTTWAVPQDGTLYRAIGFTTNKFDLPRSSAQKTITAKKSQNTYLVGTGENLGKVFTLRGDFKIDITRDVANTHEKPMNRALSMVAWGYGVTSTVNLSGIALDGRYQGDDQKNAIASTNTITALEDFSRNLGEYALRLPDGRKMQLVITSVSWSQEDAFKASVSMSAVEVDYVEQ